MSGEGVDPRVEAAERVLGEHGFGEGRVRAAGHRAEIAVISLPAERWEEPGLGGEVVPRLKALGFRYVALDLDPPLPDG